MNKKVIFKPGDHVRFKHTAVMNGSSVVMLVVDEARAFKLVNSGDGNKKLMGIECIWFDMHGAFHKQVFHTHDITLVLADEGKGTKRPRITKTK